MYENINKTTLNKYNTIIILGLYFSNIVFVHTVYKYSNIHTTL